MELSLLQSLVLGLISGLTEVLPVSAQAHRLVILRMFGMDGDSAVLRLMIHIATVAALHFYCKGHIVRMMRAQRLVRIPKSRRKRPLDTDALMDFNHLKTTLIPIVLGFICYTQLPGIGEKPVLVAAFMLVNGVILYIPQYLPGANKDSGSLSPIDSLYFGLGAVLGILPGISGIGSAVSIGSVRGMDPKKALSLALVMNIPVNIGLAVLDLIALVQAGAGSLSFTALFFSLFAGAAAFAGIILSINLVKKITESIGWSVFGFYSWGAALLTFILYLMAA